MKLFFFLLGLILTRSLTGQVEFAPIGAEWNYEVYYQQWHPPFTTHFDQYKIKIPKDTSINGYFIRW